MRRKRDRKTLIAVIGGRKAARKALKEAEAVGALLARKGAVVLSGGLGGVMEAASRGASGEGGVTVGILPHEHRGRANRYVDIPIATGLGIGRNVVIARAADAVIAVGGEYGTLSEIAFALQIGKPVVGIGSWKIKGVVEAVDAEDAVGKALGLLGAK
ncbi:MAG: TIGR00725 family protein [Thermodesulfovibrionales bacterium]